MICGPTPSAPRQSKCRGEALPRLAGGDPPGRPYKDTDISRIYRNLGKAQVAAHPLPNPGLALEGIMDQLTPNPALE